MAAEAPVLVGFTTTLTSDCRPDYLHNYLHNQCQSCAGEKHRVLVINDRKGSWGEVGGFLEEATWSRDLEGGKEVTGQRARRASGQEHPVWQERGNRSWKDRVGP